mgnify:CR=1 FL=1
MVSEQELGAIFAEIGKEYGYDTVTAEFMAFKDFKVRWQRSYRWADFKVSDYLMDAPDGVIRGLCKSLYSRITGAGDDTYSEEMCAWVTSPRFVEDKQALYLKRCRNIARTTSGSTKDLSASYARLVEMGLANEDPTIYLSWSEAFARKAGSCSVLMRVITMSKALDSAEIPDFVLDYCLYHEICHLLIGFDPTGDRHSEKFLALEAKYPRQAEAEEWLDKLCLHL